MIQEGLAAKAAGDDGHRHDQARPGRPARRRDRQRRGDVQAAQGRRHRRREGRHRPAQGRGEQGRRDGARHRLDQDHPDQEVSDLPRRSRDDRHRLLRRLRHRHGRRAGCRRPARRRCRRRRDPAGTPARTARRPTRPTRCSARPAATTSPPGSMPRPLTPPPAPAPTADRTGRRRRTRRHRSTERVGGRGLDRPGLVRRPGVHRPAAVARACRWWCRCKNTSVLIGRASRSRNITPDIDLSSDNGISRRHAQLTDRRQPLVGRGPRLVERHLRRRQRRRAAEDAGPARPEAGDLPGRPDLPRRLDPDRRTPGDRRRVVGLDTPLALLLDHEREFGDREAARNERPTASAWWRSAPRRRGRPSPRRR